MTRFNTRIPWTKQWRDTVLIAIENKRSCLYTNTKCGCCYNSVDNKHFTGFHSINCRLCVLGDGVGHSQDKLKSGYCREYYDLMYQEIRKGDTRNGKALIRFLDKMERAVKRRKIVG